MKLTIQLLLIIFLTSCTSQNFNSSKFTIKNLDSWAASRILGSIQEDGFTEDEIRTQDTIEFDSTGTPSASRENLPAPQRQKSRPAKYSKAKIRVEVKSGTSRNHSCSK